MRKKSYASRLGVLAVALTLVTTCLVGGTMAKYTTTAAGTGTGTVAKFDVGIKINDGDLAGAAITDLFKMPKNNNVNSNKLAPGTNGYFDLAVTNNSEVKVEVSEVKIEAVSTNASVPMQFAVTESTVTDKPEDKSFQDITNFSADVKQQFGSDAIDWTANSNTKKVRIWWQWAPGDTVERDTADTKLGTDAANTANATVPTYGLKISVKADQVIATSNTQ